jgi:hypothetical protein
LFRLNTPFINAPIQPGDEAFKIRSRMVRLWCNFIKYGDPTPVVFIDPLITAKWLPTNPINQFYLNLDVEMLIKEKPYLERLGIWHRFDKRFNS